MKILGIKGVGKDEEEGVIYEVPEFASRQVELTFQIIDLLEPRTIVVISAIASKILKYYAKKKNLLLDASPEIGTYMILVGKKNVPLFFSGMLARQHALDVFSRERLIWHIRHANRQR